MNISIPRTPWPANFPDVIIHCELRARNTHPTYKAAKAGDITGWHRLVTPAVFAGTVIQGADYLLVDDHVGFGGTLANLRGYIEVNRGRVIGMTTLTETGGGRKIAVLPETLFMIQEKHGDEFNHFWQQVFGYGTDYLTNIEAGYLCRVESVAAIKTRMAAAATAARRQGLPAVQIGPKP
jgi:hypothetical protein